MAEQVGNGILGLKVKEQEELSRVIRDIEATLCLLTLLVSSVAEVGRGHLSGSEPGT